MKTIANGLRHLPQRSQSSVAQCVVWLFLLLACAGNAAQSGAFTYEVSSGMVSITGYTGSGGAVTIPSTINGLPVSSIRDGVFYGRASLTSVTIPNSVTSIGDQAFSGCTGLASVTIPNRVASIGDMAFYHCTSLTAITVDALNSVYSSLDGVLFNKSHTTLLQYPAGKVGSYTIPNSVSSIGKTAFQGCTGLTNVNIGRFNLIESMTFYGCTCLTAISVDTNNPVYSSVEGVLFDKSQTTLLQYPAAKAGSYTIPNDVTSIRDGAFSGCVRLANITIPNSVTNIGERSFQSCTGLTSVTIPNSVTNIGDQAFSDCTGLASVNIGNGVTDIGNAAFHGCTGLTSITIPNSVTNIGGQAFSDCTGLASITIPNSVTSIGGQAFSGCTGLTSITIPESVTSIACQAFLFCNSLTGAYFQGSAPSVDLNVFYGDNQLTLYYLAGTTGWGSTFGGRPTVLWNPHVQTSDASLGVKANQFGFTITGTGNLAVVVDACTDLANPAWVPLQTNILASGLSNFSDPQWTNYPARFYRLRMP